MRLRDQINKPKEEKKKTAQKPPQSLNKPKVKAKLKEEPIQPPKKKEIGRIITEEDLQRNFDQWITGCKCGVELKLIKEKPGTNWSFYKLCPSCNIRTTTLYFTDATVDEFLNSYSGQFWRESE